MNFVLKTRNFVLRTRNCVFKTRNFVLNNDEFCSGGFTTAWAVSQTDRFKCGVMGAGYGDWLAFQGKAALCGEPQRWIPGVQFVDPYSRAPDAPSVAQYVFDAVCFVYTCRRLIDLSPILYIHASD